MPKVKAGLNVIDLYDMSIVVLAMIAFYEAYAMENGLRHYLTSLMTDPVCGRGSTTHADGRAVDAHMNSWSKFHRERFSYRFNKKFKHVGAIKNGVSIPLYIHGEGSNLHAHMQCRPEGATL